MLGRYLCRLSRLLLRYRSVLEHVRPAPLSLLLAVVAVHVCLKGVFFSSWFLGSVGIPVENATEGLITIGTLAGTVVWVLIIGGMLRLWGGIRVRDLGLSWESFREALPVVLSVWLVSQLVLVVTESSTGGVDWAGGGPGIGWWIGQRIQSLVGSGLTEEVLYRGFFLGQIFLLLRVRYGRDASLTLAIVASSVYFGLNHIPGGLAMGLGPEALTTHVVQMSLGGALFATLYLRSGNLFVAVGAHTLINDPISLLATTISPSLVVLISVALLLLTWPALAESSRRRLSVGVLEGRPVL